MYLVLINLIAQRFVLSWGPSPSQSRRGSVPYLLDEHAEPLAIPMPYLSSAVMRVAPSIEGKPKNDVFFIRGTA